LPASLPPGLLFPEAAFVLLHLLNQVIEARLHVREEVSALLPRVKLFRGQRQVQRTNNLLVRSVGFQNAVEMDQVRGEAN
jgi:hypothetical protein